MRKCFAINYLLHSSDHFVTVKEELQLFDSLFSYLILFHEEYNCFFLMLKSLTLRNLIIGLKIFTFKHWLKLETGLSKLKWIESQKYQ